MTSCVSFLVAWLTHAAIVTASRRERLIGDTGYVVLDQPEYESSPEPLPDKELECSVRLLAYQYALDIQPHRGPAQPATYDALFIDQYCNGTDNKQNIDQVAKYKADLIKYEGFNTDQRTLVDDVSTFTVYVDPNRGNDANDGTLQSPFGSLQRALESTRSQSSNELNKQIVIRQGILFLNETITLSPSTFDNNLMITSYPQEEVWISGGVRIGDGIENLKWERYDDGNPMHNIWRTKIDEELQQKLYNHSIYSLFTETPHRRLVRARYPNGDLEVFRDSKMFISATNTIEWFVAYGDRPKQIFKNLSCAIPENEACLNYSAFKYYNDYTIGYGEGTVCDLWTTESFWCGLYTSGGWAFEDQFMSTQGRRQLPMGMRFNTSNEIGKRISSWTSRISDEGLAMVIHDQGWNMNMNRISSAHGGYDLLAGNISFEFGGFQGSRVNRLADKDAVNNQPIKAGSYYFDGIFDELDVVNEWYFNKTTGFLYYFPNDTDGQPPNLKNTGNLIIGNLSALFLLQSDSHSNPLLNVTISNLKFRDTRYTFMDRWGVPSGGDWALYKGGAIYMENTTLCSVEDSCFDRLDGNVIMLYGYNRNTSLLRNEFYKIGDNVMAGWGETQHDDGTAGLQPWYTEVAGNYVHEIGLYQLQSSFWFQAKTPLTMMHKNIVFNVPRAAINFNDGFGGGNEVSNNLLFNTCTESGDVKCFTFRFRKHWFLYLIDFVVIQHGPINSWDRVPFLSTVAHGYPSYDALYTEVHHNFIFANYGASQAFDTDDGSAWYDIHDNFGWDAQGVKNDYGGYNKKFHDNLNVVWGNKARNEACWNIGATHYEGPTDNIWGNRCIVYSNGGPIVTIRSPTSYKGSALVMQNNSYFSVFGNTTWQMSKDGGGDAFYNLEEIQSILGFEKDSTVSTIPSNDQIIEWAKEVLLIV